MACSVPKAVNAMAVARNGCFFRESVDHYRKMVNLVVLTTTAYQVVATLLLYFSSKSAMKSLKMAAFAQESRTVNQIVASGLDVLQLRKRGQENGCRC